MAVIHSHKVSYLVLRMRPGKQNLLNYFVLAHYPSIPKKKNNSPEFCVILLFIPSLLIYSLPHGITRGTWDVTLTNLSSPYTYYIGI